MGKILCSTRGGEASIRTQEAAIKRAKESGDELIFFYVADVEFLAQASYALRTDVVSSEIEKMADFLMTMACERASSAGLEARFIIEHGNFAERLMATIADEEITLVVLGRPADEESKFKLSALESFAEQLAQETGVEVWVPPAEMEDDA